MITWSWVSFIIGISATVAVEAVLAAILLVIFLVRVARARGGIGTLDS